MNASCQKSLSVCVCVFCKENYENSKRIFADFISITDTNISVRDFSAAGDEFTVLTNESTGVGAYSAAAENDGNTVNEENLQQLRGYFVK